MGDHHNNPLALMAKNAPPNTQMVRVLKLEQGLEVLPSPGFMWVPDVEKGELCLVCIATVMNSSPILGATVPHHVGVAEVMRVPYEQLREAIRPEVSNGEAAE